MSQRRQEPKEPEETTEQKKPFRLFFIKIITYLVIFVLVGVFALLVWIFIPTKWHIKVAVESATLSRFDLEANTTLRYNLTLGVSIRNANRAVVSYDKIAVTALNNGAAFSSADVPAFNQGWKTTTMVYPAFHGQWPVAGNWSSATYNKERGEGIHSIDVRFNGNIRIRYEAKTKSFQMRTRRFSMAANCALRIPRAGLTTAFNKVICNVKL